MAASPNLRATLLLLVALALVLSGAWLATSTGSPPEKQDGTLIEYHGVEGKAVLPLRSDRLPGAPAGFRAFVKGELRTLWDEVGHTQACKTSPLIVVERLRTDGFALGTVSTRARKGCDSGGGYVAFWAVRDGAWKQVIGTQEVVSCAKLKRFGIPAEIGVHECYQGGEVVTYDHP